MRSIEVEGVCVCVWGSFRTMKSKRPWPGFLLGAMRRHWKSGASLWQDVTYMLSRLRQPLWETRACCLPWGERSEMPYHVTTFSQVTRAKGQLSLSSEKRVCLLGSWLPLLSLQWRLVWGNGEWRRPHPSAKWFPQLDPLLDQADLAHELHSTPSWRWTHQDSPSRHCPLQEKQGITSQNLTSLRGLMLGTICLIRNWTFLDYESWSIMQSSLSISVDWLNCKHIKQFLEVSRRVHLKTEHKEGCGHSLPLQAKARDIAPFWITEEKQRQHLENLSSTLVAELAHHPSRPLVSGRLHITYS